MPEDHNDPHLGLYSPMYFPVPLNHSLIFLRRASFCQLTYVADSVG